MATSFYSLLLLPIFFFHPFLPSVCSISFEISRFEIETPNILYHGDAIAQDGAVEFNKMNYVWRIGWVTYAERVPLWDSHTGMLADFATHFSFTIDTQYHPLPGHGLSFFLAPVGFEIPPNSGGCYLGLFNTTTINSTQNQIVLVEFDSHVDPDWDPNFRHIGINKNSLNSSVYTAWNASVHSGDTADVWITYNATTQNLSVSWRYLTTSSSQENSNLFYQIDLMKFLPQWVTVGFSAATGSGEYLERHILKSWKFSSSLNIIEKREKGMNRSLVGGTVFGGVLICGVVIAFAVLWRKQKKRLRRKQNSSQTEDRMNLTSVNDLEREAGPKKFSYRDLLSATNNFSIERKLGEGGFGVVFKGYLYDIDMAIAVKKFSKGSKQGKREYITEVKIINMLRHRNLVRLIGWCHEKDDFLLVYEFMPNGSLDSHLFDNKSLLTWAVRYKIALGLASGLLYLHEEGEQYVVHRDIKSSNVMLDSSFNAKLGDFGLARLMDYELGPRTTGLAGTVGYMAPEYIYSGRASKESDVFSFGMVALEIATGKKSVDTTERKSLLEWVWEMYGTGKLLLAVDERLNIAFDMKQAECLMIVGLWCAHLDSSLRPSIKQAIQVLNFDAEMPNLPTEMPIPTYCIPTKLDRTSGVEISISSSSPLC